MADLLCVGCNIVTDLLQLLLFVIAAVSKVWTFCWVKIDSLVVIDYYFIVQQHLFKKILIMLIVVSFNLMECLNLGYCSCEKQVLGAGRL